MFMEKTKEKNGITLVALVVTIIVLLILAGVSIAILTGNGLFEKTKEAKQKSENAQELENVILADYENAINGYSRQNSSNKVKIKKIGDYNSINSQNINISTILPDDYKNLTIRNFVILNANMNVANGYETDDKSSLIDEYDPETGIIKLHQTRIRNNGLQFYFEFTLGCIIGEIEE